MYSKEQASTTHLYCAVPCPQLSSMPVNFPRGSGPGRGRNRGSRGHGSGRGGRRGGGRCSGGSDNEYSQDNQSAMTLSAGRNGSPRCVWSSKGMRQREVVVKSPAPFLTSKLLG